MLRRNCLLKHVTEAKMEGKGRLERRSKKVLDDLKGREQILEFETGSPRSQPVDELLWKTLWTCRKID